MRSEPSWLTIARAEIGVHETPGPASTARISEYLATAHAQPNDEIPWCSAFVNWCMAQARLPTTDRLAARSWLKWGRPITRPTAGAVAVLWRDDPAGPHGHVGFFLHASPSVGTITLLGGNQANSVCIRTYPKARVLGYRWANFV